VSADLGNAIAARFREPVNIPSDLDGAQLVVLGDEAFPNQRFMDVEPPMLPAYWVGLERSLLTSGLMTLGVAGSRDTTEHVLDLVRALATAASRRQWLVVSGLAQGVDSAAHEGGIAGGTGTVGVLASGISNASKSWMPPDPESLCLVSQFGPSEPWSGPRAMQRNSTIASLSDRVVIAASGTKGGSWEMGNLCINKKKHLFVFDLDPQVAEGNQQLIRKGGIAIDPTDIDGCLDLIEGALGDGGQTTLFG
jgi:DNA processing protein